MAKTKMKFGGTVPPNQTEQTSSPNVFFSIKTPLFRQAIFYLAELFRQATFYLVELFRQAMFYLAKLFRQIASP